MAKLYGNAAGEIIRFVQHEWDEQQYGEPEGFTSVLEFDPETNAAVVQALNTNWNAHTLVTGVLMRDGQPVVIAAPGAAWMQHLRQTNAKDQAQAVPSWASWTEQQVLDHIDANVTSLATAKVVIKAMARMLVALRNAEWPDLEE